MIMRREQISLTPEQLQSGLPRERLKTLSYQDLAPQGKIVQAVAGFTSTYSIMEDNRVVYHGSNDLHGDFSGTGVGPNGGLNWSLSVFDISTHTGIGAGVDDALNMSWWFDHKNATTSINPSWAGLTPIRLPLTLNGSGFWDEKTYDTDNVLDKFQNSWPNYWFSSGALNGEPFISMNHINEITCGTTDSVVDECESSLYANANVHPVVKRYYAYASYLPTVVVPLGYQQTFYGPDSRTGDGEQYLNFFRNEFDGHRILPDTNKDIAL